MSRLRTVAVVLVGLSFVALGLALALVGQPAGPRSVGATLVAALIALVALVVVVWKIWGRLDANGETPAVPWATDEPFANPAPERTPGDRPLSSDDLVAVVEKAGSTARLEGTVDDGLAVVRPALRETLSDALLQRGHAPEDVQERLATGEWTDDPVAASVLEADLIGPDRPFRARVRAWLFPERVVRDRTRRAMNAVAAVANEALPGVPGQTAPRTVPVVQPRLEDLTRGADGRLQRAVDPHATARGPGPATATLESGTGDDEQADTGDPDSPTADGSDGDPPTAGDSRSDSHRTADELEGASTTIDALETSRQRRFRGGVAATILLVAAGLVDGNAVLFLGAIVPLSYVAYGSLSETPVPDGLVVTRTVSPSPVPPGQPVTVELALRNDGERTLSDVRVVDGVPADLAVLEGSPRAGSTLEPGETIRLEYLVVARRGEYDFEGVQVRCRGLGAGAVATATLSPAGDRSLHCRLDADAPPLEEVGRDRIGQLTTDQPGEGITFHSTREYRPDDPADRIDWRQYAKRGTLATVSYERQVAATVVLVVGAREPNRVVAGPGQPTAVELSAYAATRALTDLLGHGHDVGLAILGVDGDGPAGLAWLEPGRGREQRSRALELLRTATAFDADEDDHRDRSASTSPRQAANWRSDGQQLREAHGQEGADRPDSRRGTEQSRPRADHASIGSLSDGRPLRDSDRTGTQCRKLIELVDAGSQLALFSPLLDDRPLEAVETWRTAGLPVVALSPDVVPANTVSGQYTQTRRRTRLARCQAVGARTVDWRRGTPLALVIAYAFRADAVLSSARLTAGSGGEP